MWEDLPKLRNGNYAQLGAAYARQIMPAGARHHKEKKAGRWAKRRPEVEQGICFSTRITFCSGPTPDVNDLGLRVASEALARGDEEFAQRCVDVIKAMPDEIRRRAQLAEYKRKLDSLARRMG